MTSNPAQERADAIKAHVLAARAAEEALAASDVNLLLTMAYHLTHMMHVAKDADESADLRAERDLITAEIVRRTEKP